LPYNPMASSDLDTSDPLRRRNAKRKSKAKNKRTLYDVLGASPSDSPENLRRRYTELVKQVHPDAGKGSNELTSATFTEITEAWSVLSNAKEKKKYDQSLQVKQIGDIMSTLFDVGVKAAVPIVKTTMAVVEKSSVVAQDVGQDVGSRLGDAVDQFEVDVTLRMDRFAVKTKGKELDQKAARMESRAEQFRIEFDNLPEKCLVILKSKGRDLQEPLSSVECNRILEGFLATETKISSNPSSSISTDRSIRTDIETLEEAESEYKLKANQVQTVEQQVSKSNRELERAVKREQSAQDRFLQAQAELEAAQKYVDTCRSYQLETNQVERSAENELKRAENAMNQKIDRVRTNLSKKEESLMKREGTYLQDEACQLEKDASQLRRDAEEYKKRAEEMKREQQRG